MVQNKVLVVPECFLARRKTRSKEQKSTYVTIQTMSKHFVSLLNSRQAVPRAASHWQNGQGWPRK